MTQTGKIVPVDFSSVVKDTTLGSLFFATLREERADSFVLRFLRARKWNPEKAADMLLYVVKFFHCENIERIIFYGESEIDASMLHKGLVFFQGRDKLNCPIVPWWFSGLFKMIKPLIDPVVASKIQFCKTGAELSSFITSSNIKTNRDNTIDYKYDYIPPKMNENELMKDLEGKKTALENHRKTCEEFKTLTEQWIDVHKHRSGSSQSASSDVNKISNARNACEEQLLESSLKLDKYTRAKNIYDRL
ncbi:CRAL-TRIO domain-containing protein [Zancudomyces culisetae]|uniref:CRAL-TRIO domain-containing protein n=1 Tax=Zancudomyces culisetae TaxID=1213189 RepID=A0A1R1PC42_ZANCU|nr:CRAL-TRIO domain-containing protein [Zancudomyces culisetae]|eukprot:OMH78538.1 CRAL-TRIO domain-containing protein [Zancudomyces culisetae]